MRSLFNEPDEVRLPRNKQNKVRLPSNKPVDPWFRQTQLFTSQQPVSSWVQEVRLPRNKQHVVSLFLSDLRKLASFFDKKDETHSLLYDMLLF